jgi:hypothetical protein
MYYVSELQIAETIKHVMFLRITDYYGWNICYVSQSYGLQWL